MVALRVSAIVMGLLGLVFAGGAVTGYLGLTAMWAVMAAGFIASAGIMYWTAHVFRGFKRPKLRDTMKAANQNIAYANQMMSNLGGGMAAQAQTSTSGMSAEARVQAVRDTGALMNYDPIAELELLVTPDGSRHPVPLTVRRQVPKFSVGQVVPGAVIPARYDPSNPEGIILDFATMSRLDTL